MRAKARAQVTAMAALMAVATAEASTGAGVGDSGSNGCSNGASDSNGCCVGGSKGKGMGDCIFHQIFNFALSGNVTLRKVLPSNTKKKMSIFELIWS